MEGVGTCFECAVHMPCGAFPKHPDLIINLQVRNFFCI
jgi:hypothetical protein